MSHYSLRSRIILLGCTQYSGAGGTTLTPPPLPVLLLYLCILYIIYGVYTYAHFQKLCFVNLLGSCLLYYFF